MQFFVFFVSSVILLASTFTTNSRGALFSLILGLVILYCTKFGARIVFWNAIKLSCLLVFFLLLGVETNIFDTTLNKNDLVSGRFDVWALAISQIMENWWSPILGKGPVYLDFTLPYRSPIHSTHNSFLFVAYVFGFPTLILILAVLGCVFNSILQTKNNINFSIKLTVFVFTIVQLMIDSHHFSTQFGWILLLPLVFTGDQPRSKKCDCLVDLNNGAHMSIDD